MAGYQIACFFFRALNLFLTTFLASKLRLGNLASTLTSTITYSIAESNSTHGSNGRARVLAQALHLNFNSNTIAEVLNLILN